MNSAIMNTAVLDLKHYGKPSPVEQLTILLYLKFSMVLLKFRIHIGFLSFVRNYLTKKLYTQWTSLSSMLESNYSVIDKMPSERAIEFAKDIEDLIEFTIKCNEDLSSLKISNDLDYQIRYKQVLKTLNKTNNKLHQVITKDLPVNRTPDNLREGLAKISMSSKSFSS